MNAPTEPQVLRSQRGPLFSEGTRRPCGRRAGGGPSHFPDKKMGGKGAENKLGLERDLTFLFLAQGIRKGGEETEGSSQQD